MTEASRLLEALRAAQAKDGGTMTAYTVLSSQNDPFRRDTAAGTKPLPLIDSAWGFAEGSRRLIASKADED